MGKNIKSKNIKKEFSFDVDPKRKAFSSCLDSLYKNGSNSVDLNTELNKFLIGNHLEKGDCVIVTFQHIKNP